MLIPTAAHMAAGGSAPLDPAFFVACGLLAIACVSLADRRRGPVEIGAVMLLSQPGLHALLAMAGHGHGDATAGGMAMVLAHVVAAAILTVLLSGGESALWALASLSATIMLTHLHKLRESRPVRAVTRWVPVSSDTVRISCAAFVGDTVPRRGPPLEIGR
ncbi:hypothetical protein EF847_20030 [Actinobacteria bacterium YIM 96077]|uniref:Uncharacterized protein n=1 Tax=Phytoactinopolyspora halophila TaxID=1981511 RepID=A0A329QA27_9ACTN|nr:hypothetical protein EF847_20030 [Actinobacteria bacterium YIM 96077]RAW09204.1 hypothetical protein DPM12_22390 [Phytoactinopolyspora halophila]